MTGPTPGQQTHLQPADLLRNAPVRVIPVFTGEPLRTSRMTLRPLRPDDRDEFLRVVRLSRQALERTLPLHRPDESDEAMFERQLAMTQAGDAHGTAWRRVGILADGRIAGAFNLTSITRGLELTASATWWVASDLTGQGLATEGVGAMVAHALADPPAGLGLHRLEAWITRDNAASMRVAARCGFQYAGAERSYLLTGHRWVLHDLWTRDAPFQSSSGG